MSKEMKLTEEYSVIKRGSSFSLEFISKEIRIATSGKHKGKEVRERYTKYSGTLYQVLKIFIDEYTGRYSDDPNNIGDTVNEALEAIEKAKETVEKDWKVVKVSRI